MSDLTTDLSGHGIIVTAAGGSIGSATALALARCGARLALNDIDADAVQRTCEAAHALGAQAYPIVGDVSDYASVQAMAARAIDKMGGVFGLVNIAGAAMPKPILEMSPQEWSNTWNINVTSLFNWAHAVLPHMLSAGGRIINNSSISGKQGGDENSVSRCAYAAAKAGVLGFTRGLAREVAPKVTVNAICPGLILNPRTTKLYEARPQMMDRYPMARPGVGADIAKAVVYFMAADWVTGEVTDVNGGYFID
jgi:3-oxoacyl-[acyl-carrier protein] reductase